MRPEDLSLVSEPTSPTVHGDLLVVSVATPDPKADEYASSLVRVPLDGGEPVSWTWGSRDTAPTISPDGRWLAFLRPADTNGSPRPQLHVMPTEGGEARCLTSLPLGVGRPVWAPDSRLVAFTARIPEAGRYGTTDPEWDDAPGAEAEAPRRITRLDYRVDTTGYLRDRMTRLFTLDVGAALADRTAGVPEPVELTNGGCSVSDPAWTADGTHLVVSAPRDLGVAETLYDDIYAVPATGGEPILVARSEGDAGTPSVTADGVVLYVGTSFVGQESTAANNHGLFAVPFPPDGQSGVRRLTDVETVDCEPAAGEPIAVDGGVLVGVRNRGAVELRRVPLAGTGTTLDRLPLVVGEHASVKAFAERDGRIVAVVSTPDSPGEVVRVFGDDVTTLTTFAGPLQAAGLRPLVELETTASDGYPVHGWLVLPEGDGPHPVLLCVHGGPFMYHSWGYWEEAQVYASAGYAVVLANPRGSAGYGQAHGKAVVRGFGTVDAVDVLALLDAALERPDCDAEQVGVMGGSYGGFMTSWLAAHHGERFKAAWSERALNAWDSFHGSSDIGWFFTEAYCGTDQAEWRRASPLTYADRISIPFTVAHSELDWRCPIEQGQRMFVALRRNGVAAEFVVFPGESHELTRGGKPRHRVQRYRLVLDWWARHLKQR